MYLLWVESHESFPPRVVDTVVSDGSKRIVVHWIEIAFILRKIDKEAIMQGSLLLIHRKITHACGMASYIPLSNEREIVIFFQVLEGMIIDSFVPLASNVVASVLS